MNPTHFNECFDIGLEFTHKPPWAASWCIRNRRTIPGYPGYGRRYNFSPFFNQPSPPTKSRIFSRPNLPRPRRHPAPTRGRCRPLWERYVYTVRSTKPLHACTDVYETKITVDETHDNRSRQLGLYYSNSCAARRSNGVLLTNFWCTRNPFARRAQFKSNNI